MFDFLLVPWPWLGIVVLLVGFLPLIKGADFLVDGAASLARRLGIPTLVIGLTIVAFGTSTPELLVNVFAAISGSTDIALGNIVGSNLANILLILGVSSLFSVLRVQKSTLTIEIPLVILTAGVLWVMSNDVLLEGGSSTVLGRIDGILLLVLFVFFLFYNFDLAQKGGGELLLAEASEVTEHLKPLSIPAALGFIVLGLAALFLGGKMVVEGAVVMARLAGISERVIGLTIVSIGTSLPELVTSVVAALKKESDIAVGNIVGSNIFNVLLILGVTAVIAPIPVSKSAQLDLVLNIAISALLLVFAVFGRSAIRRWSGAIFTMGYAGYLTFLFFVQ